MLASTCLYSLYAWFVQLRLAHRRFTSRQGVGSCYEGLIGPKEVEGGGYPRGYNGIYTLPKMPKLNLTTDAESYYYINGRRLSVTEVRALYGRLSCGWLRVVCAWRDTLRREVGVAGWARSLRVKQLGATGGARRQGAS